VRARDYITAYPSYPRPSTSSLNYEAKQDRANLTLVELSSDGSVLLFNGAPTAVDLLADASGYFVGGGTASADGSFTAGVAAPTGAALVSTIHRFLATSHRSALVTTN
jgi:hypothetical protein